VIAEDAFANFNWNNPTPVE